MSKLPFLRPLKEPIFANIISGFFLNRPNRFVIHCVTDHGFVEAYLPNPGRLWELLLPGRIVYLVKKLAGTVGKLAYTVVAVEREGMPVMLHTHMSNLVASHLIERGKIPGLEGARIVKAEATVGRSRFDFLLERGGRPFYLEVKSCTLFGRSIAMFPDAVTLRGKRHLEELVSLSHEGTQCGLIFLVHCLRPSFFLPDYHTDLEFARAFQRSKDVLFIKPLSLEWRRDLSLSTKVQELDIPWDIIEREARDAGSYLFLLNLARDLRLDVGSLGRICLSRGYYLYAGTAKRSLTRRLSRHLRKDKRTRWHIDYLTPHSEGSKAIPIRSSTPLEHDLAKALQDISDWVVPSFGSSDCTCRSHLFGFRNNPLHFEPFVRLLQYFRMDRLEEEIHARAL